jgi:hypothetical protein
LLQTKFLLPLCPLCPLWFITQKLLFINQFKTLYQIINTLRRLKNLAKHKMTQAYQLSLFDQPVNTSLLLTTLPKNFQITQQLGKGGVKTKAANNLKAIELSKKLDQEHRYPTPAEQAILSEYLGWGAAPDIFSEPLKPDWRHLGTQLKELLTLPEYQAARKSIINAYYTTPEILAEVGFWNQAWVLDYSWDWRLHILMQHHNGQV